VCYFLINLPSPTRYSYAQSHFDFILGNLPIIYIISLLGVFAGSFINAYVISRFKIFTKGRYLWLRLMGASIIGQLVFTIITLTLNLIQHVSRLDMYQIIIISYTVKLLVLLLVAYPMCFLIHFIKRKEKLDVYDHNIEFNPFKVTL